MSDEDDRLVQLALQVEELVLHVLADERVERAERLVHQQDLGVGRQGAGQADALLHAARELHGQLVLLTAQADHLDRLAGPVLTLGPGQALDLEAEGHVVDHGAVRQEREVLEDHADLVAAQLAQGLGGQPAEVDAVDPDVPGGRLDQVVEHADEGRLAGTGQAHDHEDLPGGDLEVVVDDRSGDLLGQVLPWDSRLQVRNGLFGASSEDLVQRFDC
ncbi:hypothetical protein GCM10029992_31040 [Glycomyces albus]